MLKNVSSESPDKFKIKTGIIKELQSSIHTIDPALDIDECVNILFRVMKYEITMTTKDDLDGFNDVVSNSLIDYFIYKNTDLTNIGSFCKSFEPFIKKLYCIFEENDLIEDIHKIDQEKHNTITPFLTKLNKVKPIYKDVNGADVLDIQFAKKENGSPVYKLNVDGKSKIYKRLYSSSLKFDEYLEIDDPNLNAKYENDFILYLVKSVILKNEQSHQSPNQSPIQLIKNLYSTLIAELWIIDFFKKELLLAIKNADFKSRDFRNYIEEEIERFKPQSNKYVFLNLKELTREAGTQGRGVFIDSLVDNSHRRLRILGQGGSGKTTTIEYLFYRDALKWVENPGRNNVPVIVSLANIPSGDSVIDNISKKLNIEVSYTQELLKANKLILFLDGVNEITSNREAKKHKLQEISSLIDDFPDVSILITDRYEFDSYQNNMFNIPSYSIQKLNEDQIKDFVEKYCLEDLLIITHVMKVLESKPGIKELLRRPLVLTRAIEIIKIDNDLPEKEGQIIEKFLDTLLRREKDEKKDPLLNVRSFKLLLAFAANNIWEKNGQRNASVHEFKFNKLLTIGASEFGLESFNAGYITRIGYELEILSRIDDQIKFYHQSYIEFFVKHYLLYDVK